MVAIRNRTYFIQNRTYCSNIFRWNMKILCSPICKRCVRIIYLYVNNVRPLRANIINYPFGEVDTIWYHKLCSESTYTIGKTNCLANFCTSFSRRALNCFWRRVRKPFPKIIQYTVFWSIHHQIYSPLQIKITNYSLILLNSVS